MAPLSVPGSPPPPAGEPGSVLRAEHRLLRAPQTWAKFSLS
jgi:hypothetical protein